MWVEINQQLKARLPGLHAFLKRRSAAWRATSAPLLPALKRVRGDFLWVHPRVLTLDTTDHEPHICRWILAHLPSAGVLFDVGAHCGWLSIKAARHAGRRGCVVAFEPSPALLEILQYHQRRNRVPQLTVIGKAVSDVDAGRAPLYLLNDGMSYRNSLTIGLSDLPFLNGVKKTAIETSTITLDSFCETQRLRPDVIKIDVEGAELLVLRGASRTLRQHRPVLVLSVHPYWLPPSQSAAQIFDFLAAQGYSVKDSHIADLAGFAIGDYLLSPDPLR